MSERASALWSWPSTQQIAGAITGRDASAFAAAWAEAAPMLEAHLAEQRLVLAGGAGFIARQTLDALLPFEPAEVLLLDANENGLAEVVRSLRSSDAVPSATRLSTVLADVCGPELPRALAQFDPVDVLMTFSAVKHVRSERDDASILRMFEVNVGGAVRLADDSGAEEGTAVFAVSTDKAVAPASLMGASKNLMEQVLLGSYPSVTLTRFANVALSTGSLLDSWQRRLAAGEPLAVPADTWRFFVTPQEAGQLCLLASVAPAGSIVVPVADLLPETLLEDAAERFLECFGLRAEFVESRGDGDRLGSAGARAGAAGGRYPVVVTPRDSAGEKRNEAFVEAGAVAQPWLQGLLRVQRHVDAAGALAVMGWLRERAADPAVPILGPQFDEMLAAAVPGFSHVSGASLDERA
jgi:nucleoside-diphosphate-sugar epimerase